MAAAARLTGTETATFLTCDYAACYTNVLVR